MTEQLYGGKLDGLEVETVHRPDFFIMPDGSRYSRRRDGRLYEVGCLWDDDTQGRVKS